MTRMSFLFWILALCFVYVTEAQYKFKRLPAPPQIFKKSWAPGSRIPLMGNSVHMSGNFVHKRPLYKPLNYRLRRPSGPPSPPPPPPMYNVLPNAYKSPLLPGLGMMNMYGPGLGQRVPAPLKELHSIAKPPVAHHEPQYSPEFRPELIPSLSTHRGGIDNDKGPIHTIPAPNLGIGSKTYQQQQQQLQQQQETARRPYSVTQVSYANVFNGEESKVTPQRVLPPNSTPTNNVQHQYEVTESNEVISAPSTYFAPDIESTHYSSSIIHEQQAVGRVQAQANDQAYLSQAPLRPGNQAGHLLQANLHSTMHVGGGIGGASGPASEQRMSELPEGQTGAGDPPMSASKLYEALDALPPQLTGPYTLNQQPKIQQHHLQQQLNQMIQQQENEQSLASSVKASFSQPTLHSFNYEEQSSKQKQQHRQNVFVNKNYAAGRVTADYSLASEPSGISQEVSIADPGGDQHENNIEFENTVGRVKPTAYFPKQDGSEQSVPSQFYTTLPNRDAAEKLAALAAAGNVNSQLIGQLRKQQHHHHQEDENQSEDEILRPQSDQALPANHKEDQKALYEENYRDKSIYRWQKTKDQLLQQGEEKENYSHVSSDDEVEEGKRPMRIFVPENGTGKEKDVTEEYDEYENEESEIAREREPVLEESEFGSRIVSKMEN